MSSSGTVRRPSKEFGHGILLQYSYGFPTCRKMMNSDGSSDEEYGNTELDEVMQKESLDSSESNEDVVMMMIMSIQEEMGREVRHVLNFKD